MYVDYLTAALITYNVHVVEQGVVMTWLDVVEEGREGCGGLTLTLQDFLLRSILNPQKSIIMQETMAYSSYLNFQGVSSPMYNDWAVVS